jgi:hypothetical protein
MQGEGSNNSAKTVDYAAFATSFGKDVNGNMLFSYNGKEHEYYCEFSREHYPDGLFVLFFFSL